jgi:hypothetical protein
MYRETVFLAGIPVEDKLVLTIASRLRNAEFEATAERLETAYDRETIVLALNIHERDEILQALVDCPDEFAELRTVLVQQQMWRRVEGIS